MTPVNVLVIFASQSGRTEKLALAAAVGAVQARANIRLRRLPDNRPEPETQNEVLARMQREYVPPEAADAIWADAVIIAMDAKLAGLEMDPEGATAYGRRAADAARVASTF